VPFDIAYRILFTLYANSFSERYNINIPNVAIDQTKKRCTCILYDAKMLLDVQILKMKIHSGIQHFIREMFGMLY
jgi:hypothetical protein